MRRGLSRFLLAFVAGILVLSCTADRINEPADGALRIHFVVEDSPRDKAGAERGTGAPYPSPQVDSVRVVIRDLRERTVAAEAVGYSGSGDVLLELSLPAARDLAVLMSGDGPGADDTRGTIYFGRQSGIAIERGKVTEATIVLSRTATEIDTIEGSPGNASYIVRWRRIPFVSSYTLREYFAGGFQDFTISAEDTLRLFTPGVEQGVARLPQETRGVGAKLRSCDRQGEAGVIANRSNLAPGATEAQNTLSYRARGELPLGPGVFGDSMAVDLSLWFDLPSVTRVSPGDESTGVLDMSEIAVKFDRQMPQQPDTLVTLRAESTGGMFEVKPTWGELDSLVILRHDQPLIRGERYRVRVSTQVRDGAGRPLDQDPGREGLQAFESYFRVEEYNPLRVASVTPDTNATGVVPTTSVELRLLRAVDRTTVTSSSFTLTGPAGTVPAAAPAVAPGDTVLTLTHSQDLLFDTSYTVRLETTVLDAARGEPLDQDRIQPGLQPFVSTFRTIEQPRGPSIVLITPASGEPNHPISDPAVIAFDRTIRTDTFRPGDTVLMQRNLNGLWVNIEIGSGPYSTDGQRFTLVPIQRLRRDTPHRLVVRGGPSGIRDSGGIAFDQDYGTPGFQDYEAGFTTEQNVRVESSDPADGASQVPWDAEVRLTLDGPILSESVADTTFALLLDSVPVDGSRWISSDRREIRFHPDVPLLGYRDYTIWVGTGLRSARGGSFDQNYDLDGYQAFSSRFTTIEENVPPRVESVVPSDNALGVSPDQKVTVIFSEAVRSFLVPNNFYLTAADSSGTRLSATVTVSGDNSSAELRPANPLSPQTVYHVHVEPLVTDLFGNGLDQDPAKPGKQKFHSIFTTEQEKIPPRVLDVSPADGSTNEPVDGSVRIDFSEAIDRISISTALWIGTGGHPHPGGISFEDGDRRVIWTPGSPLLYDALYEVRVDTLLVDLAGNRLDQYPDEGHPGNDPFVSNFSTAPDLQGPRLQTVAPADGSTGVAIDTSPVLRFSEAVDPATVGPAGILLADSLGQPVAVTPSLSTDGADVTLLPGSPLAFETRYLITVSPALTDLQGNPFDGDPAIDGNQSLTAGFRTQVENIPPHVLSIVPADLAADVPRLQAVTVAFSEPCDQATIDSTTFQLLLSGVPIAGARTVAATGDTATFTPGAPLLYESRYDVRVAGVKDLKGNLLDQDPVGAGEQPFISSFNTLPTPAPAPSVVSVFPADGTLDVNPAVHPRIVFSRAMNTATFTSENPGLLRRGYGVSATRTAEPGDTSFVLTPQVPLVRGPYAWFVTSSLEDTEGNPLDQDPVTPGNQWLSAQFEVGRRPIANAGPGVCSDGSDLAIAFDGRGSSDPDGQIASIHVTWNWGDGTTSVFQDSSGLRASHTYACADAKGCDGLDNDVDGQTDEIGTDGCDESYRVVMTLTDPDGLRSADTTGVAFCAFLVRASDPLGGATGIDTVQTIRVRLTSPCDSLTVDATSAWLELQGGGPVSLARGTEDLHRVLVLDPDAALLPDTTYAIHVAGTLLSAGGRALDQQPCTVGVQEFVASFRTIARPAPPPGDPRTRPAVARTRSGRR